MRSHEDNRTASGFSLRKTRLRGWEAFAILALLASTAAPHALALDPPHDWITAQIDCGSCHISHAAPGGAITTVDGNVNLCMTCHVSGGPAAAYPIVEADQALPGPGLPPPATPHGTSHRWDSGTSGHTEAKAGNTGTGIVESGGAYVGRLAKAYIITITKAGDTGVAEFEWSDTLGGGSGITPTPTWTPTSTPTPTPATYRDEFSSRAYNGSNGTQNWAASPWSETDNKGGGATGGSIRVDAYTRCSAVNCLRIKAENQGDRIFRQADLSGATWAQVSFDYDNQLQGNDQVRFQISYNGGGSYTTRKTYSRNNRGAGTDTFAITTFTSNTRIRFRVTQKGMKKELYIDNVQIELTLPSGATPTPTSTPSPTPTFNLPPGVTGVDVPLDDGITVTFSDGASSPAFQVGDVWRVYVRPDLSEPNDPGLALRILDGKLMCSTCHDQHSQALQPFDPNAPLVPGQAGRHFQRVANDTNQLCRDCHRIRDLQSPLPTNANVSHPVQVSVPATSDFQPPTSLPLDSANQVECMTCHDVHNAPVNDGTLLRMSNNNSLCTHCHTLPTNTSHMSASTGVLWPGGQYGSPPSTFPAITDPTKKGWCTNCHQPHGWPDAARPDQDYPTLLVEGEENLCYTCHDGNPANKDIMAEFTKTSSHPVGAAYGTHSTGEPAVVDTRHAECMDCHNPHKATASSGPPGPSASPRSAGGPIAGVRGVDKNGAEVVPANYEYELCFRCHADSPGKPAPPTTRLVQQDNVRLEFDGTTSTSFHPVTTTGNNPDVPSLIGGYSVSSVITCTSCHNNDQGPGAGGGGPNGPHGSANSHLLERNYNLGDYVTESAAEYALCYKCHDRTSILNDQSFKEHDKHIRGEKAPCSVCHDPHAASQFGSHSGTHLINFRTDVVIPNNNGLLYFRDDGTFRGACYLTCHGKDHNPKSY